MPGTNIHIENIYTKYWENFALNNEKMPYGNLPTYVLVTQMILKILLKLFKVIVKTHN